EYLERTKRTGVQNYKLCRRLAGKKTLLYAPLVEWYLDHGLEITASRRKGDEDPDKALLAEMFKLLGNSAYGKLIEAKERQTRVIYTRDQ
ncbi:unnamed protein product, partial [Porites lobata]